MPTLVGNIAVRFEEAKGLNGGLGTLFISMGADIRLLDGQTALAGGVLTILLHVKAQAILLRYCSEKEDR